MTSTGQVFPTTGISVSEAPWSQNTWTAPGAVTADDDVTANVTAASFDTPDQTFVLKAQGFDFSAIPDGSTILGVTARVNAWFRTGQGAGSLDLCQLLDTSSAKVGTNQCATPVALTTTTTTIITKGSASDLWGNALDAAWVKSPNFGIALGILATAQNADVDIDYVTLEIEYTAPAIPALDQAGFRGRNDDGTEATATWKGVENANWSQNVDENFRVRFVVDETAGVAYPGLITQLQYNLNGAGWNDVNAASSVVRSSASGSVADGAVTSRRLTSGAGTFVVGEVDTGNGVASAGNLGAGGLSEVEFCVQLRSVDVVNNDLIQLRVRRSAAGAPFEAYTQTPTITAVEAAGGPVDIAGAVEAIGELAGDVSCERAAEAAVDGVAELAGDVTVTSPPIDIEGTVEGIGEVVGAATVERTAEAAIDGIGELAGDITVTPPAGIAAVRTFNGTTSDRLEHGVGTVLAAMTFGTFAALFKRAGTGSPRTPFHTHTSAGVYRYGPLWVDPTNNAAMHNGSTDSLGPTLSTNWVLVVARKATGTATPRFSVYDFTTATWTHANGHAALADWPSAGAGGLIRHNYQNSGDWWNGKMAVRAAWSNVVKWAANTTGDAQIEAAGLKTALQSWVDAAPDALWAYNQALVTDACNDLIGDAHQTARTGTTVDTSDVPSGFSFALGGGAQVAIEGTVDGVAEVAGAVVRDRAITATIDAVGELQGIAARDRAAAASVEAIGELAGDISIAGRIEIAGAVEAIGDLAGAVITARTITGAVDAVAELAGEVARAQRVAAIVEAIGELAGDITVTGPITFTAEVDVVVGPTRLRARADAALTRGRAQVDASAATRLSAAIAATRGRAKAEAQAATRSRAAATLNGGTRSRAKVDDVEATRLGIEAQVTRV